jgi:hypothetical protein
VLCNEDAGDEPVIRAASLEAPSARAGRDCDARTRSTAKLRAISFSDPGMRDTLCASIFETVTSP